MQAALLSDRGVIKVAGDDARRFLHGLVTADVAALAAGQSRFAALLTPQGKIIADFIVAEFDGGFLLDSPASVTKALAERLGFYRLRAKVSIEDISGTFAVMAFWGGAATPNEGIVYPDPRLPALGWRCILPRDRVSEAARQAGAISADALAYEAHRIALGIPSGGADFDYGEAFPHEADMDQLAGVDFDKGCYIGQEVVSRMEHRGIARTRLVPVSFDGSAPPAGTPVMAEDKSIGTMGSSAGGRGLAMLRLDRAQDAIAAGQTLTADGTVLRIENPGWARFAFPDAKAAS